MRQRQEIDRRSVRAGHKPDCRHDHSEYIFEKMGRYCLDCGTCMPDFDEPDNA